MDDGSDLCGGLDAADLTRRWKLARRQALERVEPAVCAASNEREALEAIPAAERTLALEQLFRQSWRLGRSAADRFGPIAEVRDFALLLGRLEDPDCLVGGSWEETEEALVHARCAACRLNPGADPFICDAMREAIDGLVCGLGDHVRFARLASGGRGAARCEDALYSAHTPGAAWRSPAAELEAALTCIAEGLRRRGVHVRFLGVAENRVAYALDGPGEWGCGSASSLSRALLENHFRHHLPNFDLTALAAKAVM